MTLTTVLVALAIMLLYVAAYQGWFGLHGRYGFPVCLVLLVLLVVLLVRGGI